MITLFKLNTVSIIIKAMKHYLMAFFILFSALSSPWVGAVVFSNSQNDNAFMVQQTNAESNFIQVDQNSTHHCASMKKEVDSLQKVEHESCSNCLENCLCDYGVCHKINSPLVGIDLNAFYPQNLTEILFVFVENVGFKSKMKGLSKMVLLCTRRPGWNPS